MISVENLTGLIGGIALVVYLFLALTHPVWFWRAGVTPALDAI